MKIASILLLVASCVAVAQKPAKFVFSPDPISMESMSIYRDFLASYDNGSKTKLNVSELTQPLDLDFLGGASCTKSLELEKPSSLEIHKFAPDAFPSAQIQLVNPTKHKIHDPGDAIKHGDSVEDAVTSGFAAGIFTISEIVYDKSHTHAIFSYSFHCGGLCGNGGQVIYELVNGKWLPSKKLVCGAWIS